MRKLQYVTVVCALLIGCGWLSAALPIAVTAVTTAAQLIELFQDTISPQYLEADEQCAEQIAALPDGNVNLTELSAACNELTDAFLALEAVVDELKAAKDREAPIGDKAKQRVDEYYGSLARYKSAVD